MHKKGYIGYNYEYDSSIANVDDSVFFIARRIVRITGSAHKINLYGKFAGYGRQQYKETFLSRTDKVRIKRRNKG